MYTERIKESIKQLTLTSALLGELLHYFGEIEAPPVSEEFERFLTGTVVPFSVASQVNSVGDKLEPLEFFSKKEMKEMPKLKEFTYRYREKDSLHEFRYRRAGMDKSFSSTDYKEAKRKALAFCRELTAHDALLGSPDVIFVDFAENFLQDVKKKNVSEKTFFNEYNRFKNHVVPYFKKIRLKEVKAPVIQRFLNGYVDVGQKRTAEALYYILKMILDYAVKNDVILKNPICAVEIPLHERENGKALPLDIEKEFVQKIKSSPYELTFVVYLYTGCRPCELESLAFETDGFLTFRNRKQKKNAVVYKDIPITPMLEPYVERIRSALPLKTTTELGKIFNKLVPGYRLYDLRHTFATRCQTCGVPQEVVEHWLGHKSGRLIANTYTHFPHSFMLEQAKKVEY